MKFIVIRNEKSVGDVADKAYKGLSAGARKKAEKALLRANPGLKSIESAGSGFIVRVPAIKDGEVADRRTIVDPVNDITNDLTEGLQAFESSLTNKFSAAEVRRREIAEKLKAASKDLNDQTHGKSVAKELKKHMTDSVKLHGKRKKHGLDALKKLQKTASIFDR